MIKMERTHENFTCIAVVTDSVYQIKSGVDRCTVWSENPGNT